MKKKINKILHIIVLACCILSAFVVPSMAVAFLPEGYVKDECIVYANMPLQSVAIGKNQYDEEYNYDGINNILSGSVSNTTDIKNMAMLYGVMDNNGVVDTNKPFLYNSSSVRKSSGSTTNYNYSATTRYVFIDSKQVYPEELTYNENWFSSYAYTDIEYIELNYSPFVYSYSYGGNYRMADTFTLYFRNLQEIYNELFIVHTDRENDNIYLKVDFSANMRRVVNGIEEVFPISKTKYIAINGNNSDLTFNILDIDGWLANSTQQLYTDFTVNIDLEPFYKVARTNSQVDNSYYADITGYGSLASDGFLYNMTSVRYYNSDNNQGGRLQGLIDSIEQNPVIENEFKGDYVGWISTAIGGFMDSELFPNFTIGGMLGVIVAIPLAVWFLKLFSGG